MDSKIAWPRKTREMHSHHFDSTIWNDFRFRDNDVVVASYGKAGTTWMQQIVGQLIFRGEENVPVSELSPWLDLRIPPKHVKLEAVGAQTHRRFIKTHLPVDALLFSPRAKYIYVARDGRDILWSLYNHHAKANEKWYEALNGPGLVGEPIPRVDLDVVPYFRRWLERDGYPFWSLWENVRSWWAVRDLPNVRLVHYANLKQNLSGEMRRVADFLGIQVSDAEWPKFVEHCTFDFMKTHAANAAPLGGGIFEGGAGSFIFKGTNGRWRDQLTDTDIAAYEARALAELGPECAQWLATGETSTA
ncbi:MAG: sulfotransferase domain-containing protein [Alphaproteobacteria bacterium]|nr:sulfotransferase domain-containing protein [Alphaproteobacteria bacterium]